MSENLEFAAAFARIEVNIYIYKSICIIINEKKKS